MTLGQCFCSVTGLSAVFSMTYFDVVRICFIYFPKRSQMFLLQSLLCILPC